MSKDLTKYVLVPYEEYQNLLGYKEEVDLVKVEDRFYEEIEDLPLSVRNYNALSSGVFYKWDENQKKIKNAYNKSFVFVGDLVEIEEYEMLCLENFGHKSLNQLKRILKERGLSFGMILPDRVRKRLDFLKRVTI